MFLGLFLVFIQITPLLFDKNPIDNFRIGLVLLNGTMAIILIFNSLLQVFSKRQYFLYFKFWTLFLCLPLTCIYLLFASVENGLPLIGFGMSLLIMILIVEENHRKKMLLGWLFLILLTCLGLYVTHKEILWPVTFHGIHFFYILGFVLLIFLLRSNMQRLVIEKELAVAKERYNLARNLSHDIMTPMMVLRLLLQKNLSDITPQEQKLIQNTLQEMTGIVDSIVPSTKRYEDLPLEEINTVVENCIVKQRVLCKNFHFKVEMQESVKARMETSLLERILNNLINACFEASVGDTLEVRVGRDRFGNGQIILKNPTLPHETLINVFKCNEALGRQLGLGVGLTEIREIIGNWHGLLLVTSDDSKSCALIQILLPGPDQMNVVTRLREKPTQA